jgi:hypothetical protein
VRHGVKFAELFVYTFIAELLGKVAAKFKTRTSALVGRPWVKVPKKGHKKISPLAPFPIANYG